MNKYKFGDKVTHETFGEGFVLNFYLSASKNIYFYNVAWEIFGGGSAPDYFPESKLNPAKTASAWIACSERMPEKMCNCLVNITDISSGNHYQHVSLFLLGIGFQASFNEEITHWQPLPNPPQD